MRGEELPQEFEKRKRKDGGNGLKEKKRGQNCNFSTFLGNHKLGGTKLRRGNFPLPLTKKMICHPPN